MSKSNGEVPPGVPAYDFTEYGWPHPHDAAGGPVAALEQELLDPGPGVPRPQAPVPLDAPKAPPIPAGTFTGWFGDFVRAVAAATETPPEMAGMLGLATAATIVQNNFVVRPEPGYVEGLALWVAAAMPSGNRKSAVVADMTWPLVEWERARAAEMVATIQAAESKLKTLEARVRAMREKAAKAANDVSFHAAQQAIADLEAGKPAVPTVPRLFAQDVTPEHLGTMLADNGERLGILSDEGGLFDMMAGRYSNGVPNLDLYLQAYSGTPVRVDRGSRPPVTLDHPALSIGLSPQPDVLRGMAMKKGFRGRGVVARFLYVLPPSNLGYRDLKQRPVPEKIAEAYGRGMVGLLDLQPQNRGDAGPHVLTLSAEAGKCWKAWQREVETMMRPGGALEHLKDWGGKLPGATARIAGVLHCLGRGKAAAEHLEIDGETMGRAVALAMVLLEHAVVAFDVMGADAAVEAARRLWATIESRRQATFTARDAWHPFRGTYRQIADVEGGFEVLIDHGYITEPHQGDFQKKGRPSRTFRVNPLIVAAWQ